MEVDADQPDLDSGMQQSEGGRFYQCGACMETFAQYSELKTHVRTTRLYPTTAHPPISTSFNCLKCNRCFPSLYMLQSHMVTHTNARTHQCPECPKRFLRKSGLKKHRKLHQANGSLGRKRSIGIRYEVCLNRFLTKRSNGRKLQSNNFSVDGKFYQCGVCSEAFSTYSELKGHIGRVRGNKETTQLPVLASVNCAKCQKVFLSKYNLHLHVMTHTRERSHKCSVCYKLFKRKHDLARHERHVHQLQAHGECSSGHLSDEGAGQEDRFYQCGACRRTFSEYSQLKEHMRKVRKQRGTSRPHGVASFDCAKCGKAFSTIYSLKSHMVIHVGEKKHECPVCLDKFLRRNQLSRHMRVHWRTHSASQPPGTSTTNTDHRLPPIPARNSNNPVQQQEARDSGDKLELQPGKKLHKPHGENDDDRTVGYELQHIADEKLYQCGSCMRTFSEYSELKQHVDTVRLAEDMTHAQRLPVFNCTRCNKHFSTIYTLQAHVATHTGENSHECPICFKNFPQQSQLKTHVKLHLSVVPAQYQAAMQEYLANSEHRKRMQSQELETDADEELLEDDKLYQCGSCLQTYSEYSELKSHVGQVRPGSDVSHPSPVLTFNCTKCRKAFLDLSNLHRHVIVHIGGKKHECPVCFKRFMRVDQLTEHLRTHRKSNSVPHETSLERFLTVNEYWKYMLSQIPGPDDAVQQGESNGIQQGNEEMLKIKMLRENAEQQEQNEESDDKFYQCGACLQTFGGYSELKKHVEMIREGQNRTHPFPVSTFNCTKCDKPFSTIYNLQSHAVIHIGKKTQECPVCSKRYLRKNEVKRHIKAAHRDLPASEVELLLQQVSVRRKEPHDVQPGQSTVIQLPVDEHMQQDHNEIWIGETPQEEVDDQFYQCGICLRAFSEYPELKKHVEMVRDGLDPTHTYPIPIFNCTKCIKSFSTMYNLRSHVLIHNGEKRHQCPVCPERYLRRNQVKQHITVAHRELPDSEIDVLLRQVYDRNNLNESVDMQEGEEEAETRQQDGGDAIQLLQIVEMQPGRGKVHETRRSHGELQLKFETPQGSSEIQPGQSNEIQMNENDEIQQEEADDKLYQCGVCMQAFSEHSELKKHVEMVREGQDITHPFPVSAFNCTKCNKPFSTIYNLQSHAVIHIGKKTQECPVCSKRYLRKNQVKRHIKAAHRNLPASELELLLKQVSVRKNENHELHRGRNGTQQAICAAQSGQRSTVQQDGCEVLFADDDDDCMLFQCGSCMQTFHEYSQLKKHVENVKSGLDTAHPDLLPSFNCTKCRKTFSNIYSLKSHMVIHIREKNHECPVCFKKFLRRNQLKPHVESHVNAVPVECRTAMEQYLASMEYREQGPETNGGEEENDKLYQCGTCLERFSGYSELKEHVKEARLSDDGTHPAPVSVFNCTKCEKSFSDLYHLHSHVIVHIGDKKHECPICFKRFSQVNHLTNHLKIHQRKNPAPYEASLEGFLTVNGYSKYILPQVPAVNVNDAIQEEENEQMQPESFQMQLQKQEKIQQIEIPSKQQEQNDISQHEGHELIDSETEQVQNDDKLYQCGVCMQAFSEYSELKKHVEMIRGGGDITHSFPISTFNCIKCNKPFSTINNLQSHAIAHIGKKTQECPVCSKRYLRRNQVKRHIKSAHRDIPASEVELLLKQVSVGKNQGIQHEENVIDQDSYDLQLGQRNGNQLLEIDEALQGHIGDKNHECPICFKRFSQVNHLTNHLKIHQRKNPAPYEASLEGFLTVNGYSKYILPQVPAANVDQEENNKIQPEENEQMQPESFQMQLQKQEKIQQIEIPPMQQEQNHISQQEDGFQLIRNFETPQRSNEIQIIEIDEIQQEETDDKLYQCGVCMQAFSEYSELKKHVEMVRGGEDITHSFPISTFNCTKCNKPFSTIYNLQSHAIVHIGKKTQECPVCSKRYLRRNQVKRHLKKAHRDLPASVVELLLQQVSVRKNENQDMQHEENVIEQDSLGQSNGSQLLEIDEARQGHIGDKKHECPICFKRFSQVNHLTNHLKIHQRKNPAPYEASLEGFLTVNGYSKYILPQVPAANVNDAIQEEENEKMQPESFQMQIQEQEKIQQIEIPSLQQEQNHISQQEDGFQLIRNFETSQRSNEIQIIEIDEIQQEETDDKLYQCGVCMQAFSEYSELKKHVEMVRGGEDITHPFPISTFNCTKCNKPFSTIYNLQSHVIVHIGKKTQECPVCSKRYLRRNQVKRHIKAAHRNLPASEVELLLQQVSVRKNESHDMQPGKNNDRTEGNETRRDICVMQPDQTTNPIPFEASWKRCTVTNEVTNFMLLQSPELNAATRPGQSSQQLQLLENEDMQQDDYEIEMNAEETDDKLYQCGVCMQAFSEYSELKKHVEMIREGQDITHSFPISTFNCIKCNKPFSTIYNLQSHAIVHIGKKTQECPVCSKRYLRRNQVKRHIKSAHRNLPASEVELLLQQVSVRKNENQELRHEENGSQKETESRRDLQLIQSCEMPQGSIEIQLGQSNEIQMLEIDEIQQEETDDKLYQCGVCMQAFSEYSELKKHVEMVRVGEDLTHSYPISTFNCTKCNKPFSTIHNLHSHVIVHIGKKTQECPVCSKRYLRRNQVKQHIKVAHRNLPASEVELLLK